MTEPEDDIQGIDGPRPLPPGLRARLEDALIAGEDRQRPSLAARRARRELAPLAAVAAVLLLLIGVATVLAPEGKRGDNERAGGFDISGTRLIAFNSCEELIDYLKTNALERVTAYGLDGQFRGVFANGRVQAGTELSADAATAPSAPGVGGGAAGDEAVSKTNVQEVGVDEPDTVKTDGSVLYITANGALQVVDAASKTLLATIPLANGGGSLLLEGDRLLVLGSAWSDIRPLPAGPATDLAYMPVEQPQMVITTYDVSNPADPKLAGTTTLDGWMIAGRLSGGLARIVVGSAPADLPFLYPNGPGGEDAALAHNKAVIENSTIEQWIGDRPCTDVAHPVDFSGFELITVYTVDPSNPEAPEGTSLLAGGDTVYASAGSLYVAMQRWDAWQPLTTPTEPGTEIDPPTPAPPDVTTEIHQFDISAAGPARYVASGEVGGYLLNQWAMSEHNGNLRVATTSRPAWGIDAAQPSESAISVLAPDGGSLTLVGSVGGLGHDQQIQGVRFIGDVAYVVTFRRTDPLYTIDLRDPANPAVRGALEITGYSAYLHPIGEGLLLGVGQDATEEGRTTGVQVSVFDVGDLDNPALLNRATFPDTYSQVEQDHHAFLWWPDRDLAVVPAQGNDGQSQALLLNATAGGVAEISRIAHPQRSPENPWSGFISRSVVIGDVLYTVSDAGVLATDLNTLADAGWIAFQLGG